jgi:membrane protein involved in colicin uptake
MYSCAAPNCNLFPQKIAADLAIKTCYEAEAKSQAAQQALARAIEQGVTGPALTVKQAAAAKAEAARQNAAAAVEPAKAAAAEEQLQHEAKLQSSDDLVESFIRLYKGIRAECKARGKPCCLFMENPESTAQRGLWNR